VRRLKNCIFFCCCTVVRHTNHLPVWVQKYTERMSCGSWRLELKAISSGRVGNDGIIITSNTSPKSIFKDENYRGGWVHDKARRRSLGAFSGSERRAWACRGWQKGQAGVGAGEGAGVHRLSGCPGRRKPGGWSSQLECGFGAAGVVKCLAVHLMRNSNNDLKSNKRLKP